METKPTVGVEDREDTSRLYQEAITTFEALLAEAKASPDPEPTAMTLATVGDGGRVSARVVLLKGVDARGFRFFTNYESAKGDAIATHPAVALCFHWKMLRHGVQVRVEGDASKLGAEESDDYFATRPRGSRIGAWASEQSRPLDARETFERRIEAFEQRFEGGDVPRPEHWGGYLVVPRRIEFWYGAEFRLHERVTYAREGGVWSKGLLYP
jgi:pyridoxamine 5'-phosphate oxidase